MLEFALVASALLRLLHLCLPQPSRPCARFLRLEKRVMRRTYRNRADRGLLHLAPWQLRTTGQTAQRRAQTALKDRSGNRDKKSDKERESGTSGQEGTPRSLFLLEPYRPSRRSIMEISSCQKRATKGRGAVGNGAASRASYDHTSPASEGLLIGPSFCPVAAGNGLRRRELQSLARCLHVMKAALLQLRSQVEEPSRS